MAGPHEPGSLRRDRGRFGEPERFQGPLNWKRRNTGVPLPRRARFFERAHGPAFCCAATSVPRQSCATGRTRRALSDRRMATLALFPFHRLRRRRHYRAARCDRPQRAENPGGRHPRRPWRVCAPQYGHLANDHSDLVTALRQTSAKASGRAFANGTVSEQVRRMANLLTEDRKSLQAAIRRRAVRPFGLRQTQGRRVRRRRSGNRRAGSAANRAAVGGRYIPRTTTRSTAAFARSRFRRPPLLNDRAAMFDARDSPATNRLRPPTLRFHLALAMLALAATAATTPFRGHHNTRTLS